MVGVVDERHRALNSFPTSLVTVCAGTGVSERVMLSALGKPLVIRSIQRSSGSTAPSSDQSSSCQGSSASTSGLPSSRRWRSAGAARRTSSRPPAPGAAPPSRRSLARAPRSCGGRSPPRRRRRARPTATSTTTSQLPTESTQSSSPSAWWFRGATVRLRDGPTRAEIAVVDEAAPSISIPGAHASRREVRRPTESPRSDGSAARPARGGLTVDAHPLRGR